MLQRLLDAREKARARVREGERGFTLIELLIVIVILGVLAGVVVLAVGAFNERGEVAACKSDFKAVEVAVEAYRAKNNEYPTSIGQLVPDYLREEPSTEGCTITLEAGGVLKASGHYEATSGGGGSTTGPTPAPTTSTTTTPPAVAPSTPTNVNVGSCSGSGQNNRTCNASWNASTGTAPITYEWERDTRQGSSCDSNDFDGGSGFQSGSTGATSVQLTNLTNNQNYCFRVRATNSAGNSNWAYDEFQP